MIFYSLYTFTGNAVSRLVKIKKFIKEGRKVAMFNAEELLKGLNEGQQEAVKHINGPGLCTATAGAR